MKKSKDNKEDIENDALEDIHWAEHNNSRSDSDSLNQHKNKIEDEYET